MLLLRYRVFKPWCSLLFWPRRLPVYRRTLHEIPSSASVGLVVKAKNPGLWEPRVLEEGRGLTSVSYKSLGSVWLSSLRSMATKHPRPETPGVVGCCHLLAIALAVVEGLMEGRALCAGL